MNKQIRLLIIITTLFVMLSASIAVPAIASIKTDSNHYVQVNNDILLCTKCGKDIHRLDNFGNRISSESQLAKALGLTLCLQCWQDVINGSDKSDPLSSIALLGEDGKVLSSQLPAGQGGITGEGLDAVFSSNGLLKRIGTATYSVDSSNYLTSFTELDPLWAASVSYSIVAGDITNWNGKLSTVTGTALDNVFSTNGLLKRTGTGTYTLDASTYLTGNQSITISGDASGSGTTSIALTNNGLKGVAIPSLAMGYLYYSGSAWAFQTPAGGSNPAWYGKLYASRADCNPISQTEHENMLSVAAPTPTNITVSLARCVQFTPPANITVANIRLFGVGITTNLYKFAIYPVGTSTVKVWDSGTVTTAANTWLNLTTGLPITLTAGTKYWWCVTAVAVGTVAGFRSEPAPLGTNYWGANAAPLGGTSLGLPVYAQFAVSTGVFPTNLPTIAAAAYSGGTTGSIPYGYLDYGGAK